MPLIDVLRHAARTGDWVTPYAMSLVLAQWDAAGIDKGEWQGEQQAPRRL